jgi:hypothetical protein
MAIKRCPTCARTYADDSISFCLADGALLSAPYDPEASGEQSAKSANPPPTEIMSSAPGSAIPPTQAARKPPVPLVPTMTSPIRPDVSGVVIPLSSPSFESRPATTISTQPRWFVYVLVIIAGFATHTVLEGFVNVFFYGSTAYRLLYFIVPATGFGIVGLSLGRSWPQKGWTWGLWLVAFPWLIQLSVFIRYPLAMLADVSRPLTNLICVPIAACVGSYMGAHLFAKR